MPRNLNEKIVRSWIRLGADIILYVLYAGYFLFTLTVGAIYSRAAIYVLGKYIKNIINVYRPCVGVPNAHSTNSYRELTTLWINYKNSHVWKVHVYRKANLCCSLNKQTTYSYMAYCDPIHLFRSRFKILFVRPRLSGGNGTGQRAACYWGVPKWQWVWKIGQWRPAWTWQQCCYFCRCATFFLSFLSFFPLLNLKNPK